MKENKYWENKTVAKGILQLMATLCQCDVYFTVDPNWGNTDTLRLCFLKRQWFIDVHTGKCYMIHSYLGDNCERIEDRTDFKSITDMINSIFTA